ncbi:MAG: efflux RND transporter permease subunit, partial [Candidatus Kapaibacterium sp.]
SGGRKREIRVELDAQKIQSYGLSLNTIQQAVVASNLDFPTGSVKESANQYVVRVAGKFTAVSQLEELVVGRSRTGGTIRLGDIGSVKDSTADITTFSRYNGIDNINMSIQKQTDANAVDVSALVHKRVKELMEKYKDINLKLDI